MIPSATNPAIYKTVREIVDPKHTVLVVMDVQVQLFQLMFNKQEFIQSLKLLVESARAHDVPIIYLKTDHLPREWALSSNVYTAMRNFNFTDPEKFNAVMDHGDICPEVTPGKDDWVVSVHSPNLFIQSHIEHILRGKGIETVLMTGISADFGISTMSRDSSCRGFYTIVIRDCVSSSRAELYTASMKVLERNVLVMPSAEIMKEWR